MRKRFKSRKIINFKSIFILIVIITTFYFMVGILFNGATINLKDIFLNSFLEEIINKNSFLTKTLDINITTPENLLYASFNKIIAKDDIVTISDDYFDYNSSKSEFVEDPSTQVIKKPIVYIYNTHQLEEYNIKVLYDYSIKPNVLIASYILKEKLINSGIPSIVETNNIKKYLNNNNLKYNKSYVASRYFAKYMLKEEPTIRYIIDIHRDSAAYDKTIYTLNNKKYARILFVVGLDHTNYKSNLDFATDLNNRFNKKYSRFTRGISKKTGKGVNGIYNQDLCRNAILLEVGGVDNTIEEVNNSMDLISEIISEYIKENKNE